MVGQARRQDRVARDQGPHTTPPPSPSKPFRVAVDLVGPGVRVLLTVVDEGTLGPKEAAEVPAEVVQPVKVDARSIAHHETAVDDGEGLEERIVSTQAVVDEVLPVTPPVHSSPVCLSFLPLPFLFLTRHPILMFPLSLHCPRYFHFSDS